MALSKRLGDRAARGLEAGDQELPIGYSEHVTCGALLGRQNAMGIYPPCPLPISPTDSAEDRAKRNVQLTDSPVGFIISPLFLGTEPP
jgi:hypothetical protein